MRVFELERGLEICEIKEGALFATHLTVKKPGRKVAGIGDIISFRYRRCSAFS